MVANAKDAKPKVSMLKTLSSALIQRFQLANIAGLRFGGKRDYYEVFGYKKNPVLEDFYAKYARQDLASRVIDAPAEAIWGSPPEIESKTARLKSDWDNLVKDHNLWTMLHRVDRLSRMGQYSLLLFGVDDSTKLSAPISTTGNRSRKIIYFRPLGQRQVAIDSFETDPTVARFGRPTMYEVTFDDPNKKSVLDIFTKVGSTNKMKIHHSRVLHVVENPLEDDILTDPTILKVFNLLDDLLKVCGGTSETFWLTANRGMQVNVDKEMDIDPDDADELEGEIEEYVHQLRRFIRTRGIDIKELGGKPPDPKNIFDMLIAVISGTTGIPKRILIGAEAGQLASEQDRANWAERIIDRRALYAEPYILNPLVKSLQAIGVLQEDSDFKWKWPEAFRVSPLERSQTMAAQARAVGNLSRQTGNNQPMQVVTEEEAREIVGFEGKIPEGERIEIIPPGGDQVGVEPDNGDEVPPRSRQTRGDNTDE